MKARILLLAVMFVASLITAATQTAHDEIVIEDIPQSEETENTIPTYSESTMPSLVAPRVWERPAMKSIETMEETDPPAENLEPDTEPTEPETEPTVDTKDCWTSLGTFKLTAYCPCSKCCGEYAYNRPIDENGNPIVDTASGARAEAGITIAVDPKVIPYGTQVQINGHTYIAQDTGGAIIGNHIDVYFDNHQDALEFGAQYVEVFVWSE